MVKRTLFAAFLAGLAVSLFDTAGYGVIGEGMRLPYTFPYWLLCILLTLSTFRLVLQARLRPTSSN